jgi:hypothetical protein
MVSAPRRRRAQGKFASEPGRRCNKCRNRTASLAKQRPDATVIVMTTVATCSNPAEAMLLKSLLEANNITTYVPDELTAQSAPHFSGSGIHIQVDDEQAELAKKILEEAEDGTFEDTEGTTGDEDDENQSR